MPNALLQRDQVLITHLAVRKVVGDVDPAVVLGNFEDRAAEFLDRSDRGFFGIA